MFTNARYVLALDARIGLIKEVLYSRLSFKDGLKYFSNYEIARPARMIFTIKERFEADPQRASDSDYFERTITSIRNVLNWIVSHERYPELKTERMQEIFSTICNHISDFENNLIIDFQRKSVIREAIELALEFVDEAYLMFKRR